MDCTFSGAIIVYEGLLKGSDIHIGVGSDVVCSTIIGNARASVCGTDNGTISRFFMSSTEFCLEQSKVTI